MYAGTKSCCDEIWLSVVVHLCLASYVGSVMPSTDIFVLTVLCIYSIVTVTKTQRKRSDRGLQQQIKARKVVLNDFIDYN